jgi:hypothetical protein
MRFRTFSFPCVEIRRQKEERGEEEEERRRERLEEEEVAGKAYPRGCRFAKSRTPKKY